jgi:hypothetical protein
MVRNLMLVVSAAVALSFPARGAHASEHWDTVSPHHTDSYSRVYFSTGHSWVEVIGDRDTDPGLFV